MKLTLLALLFYGCAVAQLPIDQEQHHKVVFSNSNIRVIDLIIAPGDTTLMHTHKANSVVIFLSKSELVIQNAGQVAAAGSVVPGATVYRDYGEKPVLHKVWTNDKTVFRCIVIEHLKWKATKTAMTNWPGGKAIIKENWVTAYQVETEADKELAVPCPCFLIPYQGELEVTSSKGKKKLYENEFMVSDKDLVKVISRTKNAKFILLELR